ncbi:MULTISPECIES: ribosome hibernation-promoting factor, HPF/YfiA family [unclassified Tessaracoccus]|uniref:ribosome hibernation-promoting factor, HPF/YfiA family n=1 Tax=unclassified Tessaracoccus TaxID=2635419 RepID=UPI0016032BD1|nr:MULTISPECIES: ribosome-associated translation inhibitor RaiA [unclassified Tessaracoccus]MBB1512908.1 ribosome-associated translation inhibitor RaiA [Tessaracoccus sp. MC1627]MBB1516031.1 ribosome-associated translation inhibitor RaiA [Tessaracoccus sp. MC1679]
MDIVVTGRHCTINPELKELVNERLAAVERLQDRVIRVEVEFHASEGTKDPSDAVVVQLTLRSSRGPVIRAEARSNDKTAAFDMALERLMSQLRKAADRRKTHRGLRAGNIAEIVRPVAEVNGHGSDDVETREVAGLVVTGDGPLVVREKEFSTAPLTLAQALDEMELVGHDFFLYQDADSGRPSVVYRRKAYNYGVIHLNLT